MNRREILGIGTAATLATVAGIAMAADDPQAPPAARSNSSTCGRVKLLHWKREDVGMITRPRGFLQPVLRLPSVASSAHRT